MVIFIFSSDSSKDLVNKNFSVLHKLTIDNQKDMNKPQGYMGGIIQHYFFMT